MNSVAFSPDGKRIVTGSVQNTVKVWDAETGQEILTLKGHTAPCPQRGVQPRRQAAIVTGSEDRDGEGVGRRTRGRKSSPSKDTHAACTAWHSAPTASAIATGSERPDEVKVWDARPGRSSSPSRGTPAVVTSVAFSPDGKRIVTGERGQDGEGVGRADGPGAPHPQGAHRLGVQRGVQPRRQAHRSAAADDKTVKVWDAETGQETPHPQGAHRPWSPAWRSAPTASASSRGEL